MQPKMLRLLVTCLLLAAASAATLRVRRDVSELSATYLPAAELQAVTDPADPAEPAELAVLNEAVETPVSEQGYVYKTARRLRLRQRRDVSHLPLEYLPPVALPSLKRDYLPPVEQQAISLPSVAAPPRDYLPPVASNLQLHNEYLPPVVHTTTEAATTEAPTTSTTTEAIITTTVSIEVEPETEPAQQTHESVENGVLEADGYHYSKPAVVPDLSAVVSAPEPESEPEVEAVPEPEVEVVSEPVLQHIEQPTHEYLPPLDSNAVVEGPENGESAALQEDGYHYRAIRRLRY